MQGDSVGLESFNFLKKLQSFCQSMELSIEQFTSSFTSSESLSKREFFQLTGVIMPMDSIDPLIVFNELARGWDSVQIKQLSKLCGQLDKLREGIARDAMKKKYRDHMANKSSILFSKLKIFMRVHSNPISFLREFDLDFNNSLSVQEFNRLLIATDIKQFQSKTNRNLVIAFTFDRQDELGLEKLCKDFQVAYKQIEIVKKPSIEDKPEVQRARIRMPKNDPLFQDIIPDQPQPSRPILRREGVKKEISPAKKPQVLPLPNQQPSSPLKGGSLFPLGLSYYLLGSPNPNEYQMMEEFQTLLKSKKEYYDSDSPMPHQGKYITSKELFGTSNYHLFQMASSVLMREKSRIGVARQIEPKDVIQGSIGDCYLLSSMASLISIHPDVIAEKFILNKNPANFYAIRLFIEGEWKIVTTDDRFVSMYGKAVYAKPHHNEIWVMLMEKCWAKVFGSYQAIHSGSQREAFLALSGAPSETFHLQKGKEDEMLQQLQSAYQHRYVSTMSGSEYLENMRNSEEKVGLVSGHAYSLLKIIKVGHQVLFKIRNPWGKTVWKGDWSFSSPLWSPQLRREYNYSRDPQDGSFYMPWRQVCMYFSQFMICRLNSTFVHTSLRTKTHRSKYAYFRLKINTAGHYMVTIYQESQRKYRAKRQQNYSFSDARIIVARRKGGQYEYVQSKVTSRKEACTVDMARLDYGQYIICAQCAWKHWDYHEMVLTTYGTDSTDLSLYQSKTIDHEFLPKIIESYAAQKKGSGSVKSYMKHGIDATCETNFNIESGLGFIQMKNNWNKQFESTLSMQLEGLQLIGTNQPLRFKMLPKTSQVYGFLVSPGGYSYSSSENLSYR